MFVKSSIMSEILWEISGSCIGAVGSLCFHYNIQLEWSIIDIQIHFFSRTICKPSCERSLTHKPHSRKLAILWLERRPSPHQAEDMPISSIIQNHNLPYGPHHYPSSNRSKVTNLTKVQVNSLRDDITKAVWNSEGTFLPLNIPPLVSFFQEVWPLRTSPWRSQCH